MVSRIASIGLMFLAVCLMVSSASAKEKKKGEHGTVVSATAKQLVVNVKAGKDDKVGAEKTLDVSDAVSVVVEENPAKIEDIKAGDHIAFTLGDDGKVVTIHKGHKKKV